LNHFNLRLHPCTKPGFGLRFHQDGTSPAFHAGQRRSNSICHNPLPSVIDILDITENESKDNAIFIAQTEIGWLDDLSLEGDVSDNVSDT
jgi:hypothetical protein